MYPLTLIPGNNQNSHAITSSVISYLLLNFEQYMMNNPKIQPYGGIGLGAAFYKGTERQLHQLQNLPGISRVGVKLKATDSSLGFKIGAQLLGSSQATGTAFYYPPYCGYPLMPYTTYATILQFGFTGGLVFDFGGH